MPETEPEDVADALSRLDIDIEDTATIEDFQAALEDALGYTPSATQLDLFTKAQFELLPELEANGIRAIQIEYSWGKQTRYAWKNNPGLWGWTSIQSFLAEQK